MANPEAEAISRLNAAVMGGAFIGIVGGIIMGAAWPATEADLTVTETGSVVGFVSGALLWWVGSMWLLAGLIGHGVKLGREASPSAPPPVHAHADEEA